jgi:hypothetical protein
MPIADTKVLAWVSLVSGILSLLTLPISGGIPGSGIAAIVAGFIVIRRAEVLPKYRRFAKIGLGLGVAKCVLMIGLSTWIIIAFSINPVAH